jgi:hypothetical protein
MAEEKSKLQIGEMLRHPIANVIIGFVLTGVLGTSLTQYYSMKRQQEAQHQQQIEARKQAVSQLSSLNGEVLARAERLLRTLELGESEHLDELQKHYNDAVLHWKAENHSTLLIARDVLPASTYYRFRGRLKEGFQERFLNPINDCLGRARHAAATGALAADVLSACNIRATFEQARSCSDLLVDLMYDLSSASMSANAQRNLSQQWERSEKLIADACAAPAEN